MKYVQGRTVVLQPGRAQRVLPLVVLAVAVGLPGVALAQSTPPSGADGSTTTTGTVTGTPTGTEGGAPPAPRPKVSALNCMTRCSGATIARVGGKVTIAPKGILRLRGRNLQQVTKVIFAGAPGYGDDVTVRVRRTAPDQATFRAPTSATTGPVQAVDAMGQRSRPSKGAVEVTAPVTPAPAQAPTPPAPAPALGTLDPALTSGHTYPIRGPHDYGGPDGRFGAPRSDHTHQGQDVPAACDTPLVAARGGTVKYKAFQYAAGNYIVIAGDTGYDYVYMHMRDPALLEKGMPVATGQQIGFVGATGDATGCHLHFELWLAPGWYSGGAPIDPLPALQAWEGH